MGYTDSNSNSDFMITTSVAGFTKNDLDFSDVFECRSTFCFIFVNNRIYLVCCFRFVAYVLCIHMMHVLRSPVILSI